MFDGAMSKHTSYGIGGPAEIFAQLMTKDLKVILKFAKEKNLPVYFIGSGSNLLSVSDEGVRGLVVTLGKSFKMISFIENKVFAETGVMLGKMVKECVKRNLSGVESLVGVPGTLGGALIMNAGAFGGEISNYLKSVTAITMSGSEKKYLADEIMFVFNSSFKSDLILIDAEFEFIKSDQITVSENKMKASGGRKSNPTSQI